ncbi:hypothetical protein [Streptomyces pristinaespiralis]|uniref:hypothetical protein n=1 Tax=Streptomyces pristinaespiralis TaxID=38300 RepID=UPI0038513E85
MQTITAAKNGNPEAIAGLFTRIEGRYEGDRAQIARVALWASLDTFDGDSSENFARHATRAISLALSEADEHAWFTELEWQRVTRKLEALYATQKAGDSSAYTRQRVQRLEALQAALQGFPDSLVP